MQDSQLPSKFSVPFANSAGSGYKRTVPAASQIGITAGAASLTDGFPPLTFQPVGSGGVPPFGQDFNGLLNQITAWNQWQQAGGAVSYDATFSTQIGGYPAGAIVKSTVTSGLVWYNTVDNNTTNPDGGGAAGWLEWGPAAVGLQARGYFFGTDTGSANAMSVTSTTPSSTTLVVGTLFVIKKSSAPNTTAVTLQLNSATTFNVKWADGSALASGDWPASTPAILEYDGTQLNLLSVQGPSVFTRLSSFTALSALSGMTNIQVFTSSGTYTPTSGAKKALVFLTGGGAAGRGFVGLGGYSPGFNGGLGGGAGATCIGLFTASVTSVVIGAGGLAAQVTASPANGSSSTFSTMTAGGGLAANPANPPTYYKGALGGTATGGLINIPGGDGDGYGVSSGDYVGTSGGSSFWGGGGSGASCYTSGPYDVDGGSAGRAYGAGGGTTSAQASGKAGAPGVCFILEF
jgi:hypothetical protein